MYMSEGTYKCEKFFIMKHDCFLFFVDMQTILTNYHENNICLKVPNQALERLLLNLMHGLSKHHVLFTRFFQRKNILATFIFLLLIGVAYCFVHRN